jgi:hypothetical protein
MPLQLHDHYTQPEAGMPFKLLSYIMMMVKASGWQSFDRQFEPYLRAITSGILYPWTGSGKMVHTSTYEYMARVVQHGTGPSQYENSSYVQDSMDASQCGNDRPGFDMITVTPKTAII